MAVTHRDMKIIANDSNEMTVMYRTREGKTVESDLSLNTRSLPEKAYKKSVLFVHMLAVALVFSS